MGTKTAIEWTRGEDGSAGATWNPVAGCSIVSPGCTNCYAMRMAGRLRSMGLPHYASLTQSSKAGAVWTGEVALAPERVLLAPLSWKKSRRVFVNSMSDLFHESIPDEWIDRIFAVMALCPQHTFQCLTKRADRMRTYCSTIQKNGRWLAMEDIALRLGYDPRGRHDHGFDWLSHKECLPNVWLGVSAERQQEANERIPLLLQTPAVIRFVSCEPLLGPIDLTAIPAGSRSGWLCPLSGDHQLQPVHVDHCGAKLDWVIVGGESGPHARPMEKAWAESIRDQCRIGGAAFFMKQMAKKKPIPPDIMVREFPNAAT